MAVSNIWDHLNLPDQDEALLEDLAAAAWAYVGNVTGAPVPDPAPPALEQAVRMLIGHWYENREGTSADGVRPVPFGFDELVQSYRRWVV
ncbi:head-tail connector protein [Pseudotabrizicola alkalilacus]|uniref:Phage gp6-like head-tail connector protein n=1 Tax=Pseudotabrizicola alkalilacus TaxID=2305252 RepID=A0A411Z3Q1_9RHOB|nr:head-tail connector protein [Pseudotabrizicola alkalilacus]RGP37697.1 phage gp6-like head-tail connector protein [Pseudotabrizicola alkalilacus]